ncbi:hypothetical protein AB0M36_07275 [Actinoplanes sp. NPDC051346]|uniref:hypothetical protein n=1 Tax=Actinoplanes sp. NPDC051346 TaxID=3155048 RepID=UPI00342A70A0
MGSRRNHRRTGAVSVLSAFMIGAVLGLTACATGEGDPSTLPSPRASQRSADRPASQEPEAEPTAVRPSRAEGTQPTRSRQPEPTTEPAEPTATEPAPARTTTTTTTTRTAVPAPATTRPPTSAVVVVPVPTQTTTPAQASPVPSASAVAASTGLGPFGWFLLFVLFAALIVGGLLVYLAQRKSAWDAEARELARETRALTGTRLPPVLTAITAGQREVAWLPVRVGLTELVGRWTVLIERAAGEPRRNWSLEVSGLLQDLVAAVDAENEALALGREWMLLRPRVNRVEEALAAVLAGRPQPEPPAAGEPGPLPA